MKRQLLAYGLLAVCLATATSARAQAGATDPMVGTWKLNVQKSVYISAPPYQSLTRRFETRADGWTLWTDAGVNAAGQPIFNIALRKYDGMDYPVYDVARATALISTGAKSTYTQASTIIDAYTVEVVSKEDGRVTSTVRRTMSRDGKTYTSRTLGTDAAGRPINEMSVYDRVTP
jgi:hypothetical protein